MRRPWLWCLVAMATFGAGILTNRAMTARGATEPEAGECGPAMTPTCPSDAAPRHDAVPSPATPATPAPPALIDARAPASAPRATAARPQSLGERESCASLRDEVAALRATLHREVVARTEREGAPIAFPEGLAPAFREPALVAAFGDAARAVKADKAAIDGVDCTEYPCLLFGVLPAGADGVDGARQQMEALERTMERAYPGAAKWLSTSGFEPIAGGDGTAYVRFTLAFYPEPEPGDEADALNKRMRLRRDEYVESLPPTLP